MTSDHRAALTVNAFAAFFLLGSVIAGTSTVALAFPGAFLDGMWQLNPRAREAFASIASAAVALMILVSATCLLAAVGLWSPANFTSESAFTVEILKTLPPWDWKEQRRQFGFVPQE